MIQWLFIYAIVGVFALLIGFASRGELWSRGHEKWYTSDERDSFHDRDVARLWLFALTWPVALPVWLLVLMVKALVWLLTNAFPRKGSD